MKVRTDFVTNSSSSSFICVAKVNNSSKLLEHFKEEYGKYGIGLLDEYLVTGKDILNDKYDYEEFRDYCEENKIKVSEDSLYLQASFIYWTSEGDTEGDDAWLYKHIPDEFKEELYDGDED